MWSLGNSNPEKQGLHGLLLHKTEQVDAPKFPGCSGAAETVLISVFTHHGPYALLLLTLKPFLE